MTAIVGIFDQFAPAQSAKNALLVAGFSWRQVQLNPDHEVAARAHTANRQAGDQSVSTTMGNLVRGLFGVGVRSAHGDLYGASVRHGDYVLIADADTEEQRVQAEDIMRRYQPVDLKRRET
jgi:mRNA-degrading endonuclease RelE of RelBE toxin-antitoxin system